MRLKAENLQRTGAFKVRGAVNKLATLSPRSAPPASSRPAPAITVRPSPGRRASSASGHASSCRDTAPMAKVEACRNYGAETELTGAFFEDAMAAAARLRRRDGRDFHPPLRGSARGRRSGDGRPRAGSSRSPSRHGVDPDRRRAGSSLGIAHSAARARPEVRIVGVQAGRGRLHDRRRDCCQAAERAHDAAAGGPARRHRLGHGRGDQRGDRAAARAREARGRGSRRRRRGGAARRAGGGRGDGGRRFSRVATSTRRC